jgi:hypothetical protein
MLGSAETISKEKLSKEAEEEVTAATQKQQQQ